MLQQRNPDLPLLRRNSTRPGMILGALFVTTIISYLDRYILALLAPALKTDLGYSDTQIGLLQGFAFTLLYALASVPAGYLADRSSRKGIIIFGIICWSLGTTLCGLTSTFTETFIARMIVGCGEATLGPAAIALISTSFAPSRRGRAIGIYQLGGCVGGGASLLVGGLLLAGLRDAASVQLPVFGETATWRLIFILFGLIGLLWVPFIALLREPERAPVRQEQTTATAGPCARAQSRNYGTLTAIYAVYAAASFLNSGLVAWAPTFYIQEFGRTTSQTGILTGLLTTVAVSIGCVLSGYWGDRATARRAHAGKLRVTICAFALAIPGVVLFATADSFIISVCGFGLALFAGGLMLAGAPAVLSDILPTDRRGFGMSIYFFNVAFFGLTLGPLSSGFLNDTVYDGADLRTAILWSYGTAPMIGLAISLIVASYYQDNLKSGLSDSAAL